MRTRIAFSLFGVTLTALVLGQGRSITHQPRVVNLEMHSNRYQPVLNGPPESAGMESGMVTLEKNESVGKHQTKEYEELLIVLQGEGRMIIAGQPPLSFRSPAAVYCPPRTEHDVQNAGNAPLRYVYVAAKTAE